MYMILQELDSIPGHLLRLPCVGYSLSLKDEHVEMLRTLRSLGVTTVCDASSTCLRDHTEVQDRARVAKKSGQRDKAETKGGEVGMSEK